jgi:hypothetical protein
MAAPTPVSAYLHSATMVKAGVFLMARMWPVLSGRRVVLHRRDDGPVTMVLGAVIALFKDDLKALLAFSTVSHLGLITMLLGFGTPFAAIVAVFHIINHADLQGRALHDRRHRRPRGAHPRHPAAGRAAPPDADHLRDRHGGRPVDGGHPASSTASCRRR